MPGTPAGQRRFRIEFRRPTLARGALGTRGETGSTSLGFERAKVLWGPGSERRQAGVERADQAATFRVLSNTKTRGVTPTDRIIFSGMEWDITGIAPLGLAPGEIEFTAVASRG